MEPGWKPNHCAESIIYIYSDLIPTDDPNDNDDYGNIMMITGFITFLFKKYSDFIPGSFAH
jgi:hypothetical protein